MSCDWYGAGLSGIKWGRWYVKGTGQHLEALESCKATGNGVSGRKWCGATYGSIRVRVPKERGNIWHLGYGATIVFGRYGARSASEVGTGQHKRGMFELKAIVWYN